jgi:hypothetical protein
MLSYIYLLIFQSKRTKKVKFFIQVFIFLNNIYKYFVNKHNYLSTKAWRTYLFLNCSIFIQLFKLKILSVDKNYQHCGLPPPRYTCNNDFYRAKQLIEQIQSPLIRGQTVPQHSILIVYRKIHKFFITLSELVIVINNK